MRLSHPSPSPGFPVVTMISPNLQKAKTKHNLQSTVLEGFCLQFAIRCCTEI